MLQREPNPATVLAKDRVGPILGMLVAIIGCSALAKRIEVAKLYYFDVKRGNFLKGYKQEIARKLAVEANTGGGRDVIQS